MKEDRAIKDKAEKRRPQLCSALIHTIITWSRKPNVKALGWL